MATQGAVERKCCPESCTKLEKEEIIVARYENTFLLALDFLVGEIYLGCFFLCSIFYFRDCARTFVGRAGEILQLIFHLNVGQKTKSQSWERKKISFSTQFFSRKKTSNNFFLRIPELRSTLISQKPENQKDFNYSFFVQNILVRKFRSFVINLDVLKNIWDWIFKTINT